MQNIDNKRKRLPHWLKKGIIDSEETRQVRKLLKDLNLNTVCDNARCPNKGECYSKNTATFLILGNVCTRNCLFCAVKNGEIQPVNAEEPKNIAIAVKKLNLKYVVITSVTRDDLADGGAGHFVDVVNQLKKLNTDVFVEVLIPDFQGNELSLKNVLDTPINILNHNIETVKELYIKARPQADYQQSLNLIKSAKEYNPKVLTKSGFMVGLGETIDQIKQLCQDLHAHKCDIVTIGQYIQPTKNSLIVDKYYTEEEFNSLKQLAQDIGIKNVVTGPLVRSSYKAFETFIDT